MREGEVNGVIVLKTLSRRINKRNPENIDKNKNVI